MRRVDKIKLFLDIELHKRLWAYSRPYKKQVFLITFFGTLNSLITVSIALMTKALIDQATVRIDGSLFYLILGLGTLMAFELGISSYSNYYIQTTHEKIKNTLQFSVIGQLYEKKWNDLNQFKTGDLLTRLSSDVAQIVSVYIKVVPGLIAMFFNFLFAFIVLSAFDPFLAFVTFLLTPIMILASLLVGRKLKAIQMNIQKSESYLKSLINESLQNMLVLKTFGYLNHNLCEIQKAQESYFLHSSQRIKTSVTTNLMINLSFRFGFFGALGMGAFRLMNRTISFGTFTAFLQLVGQIQGPLIMLSRGLPQLITALSSVNRLDDLIELESEMSSPQIQSISNVFPVGLHSKDLAFHYTSTHPVLKKVNFTISKGEKIAILGESGQGKTTLAHLMLSLLSPCEGKIEMQMNDGAIYEVSSETRNYFSYVPQSNTLFSGTIKKNFLLKETLDEKTLKIALETACCLDFLNEMPMGLETELGERGIGLSQGQAQRLTIARALIHNKPFLIFDEATSALDLETERLLIERLKLNYPEITLIAITHRKGILDICDRVYSIKNSELFANG